MNLNAFLKVSDRYYTSVLIPAYDLIDGSCILSFSIDVLLAFKGPKLRFAHLEKFHLNFSSSSFATRVNLLHL